MGDPSAIPRISVLLPCYNATRTVSDAIDSLLAQTFDDFEIVAVNDGSADTTGERLAEWAGRDPRIRVVTTGHRGIISALNTAVESSRGPWLARMDADDRADPSRLGRQWDLVSTHPNVAACGAGIRYFPRREVRAGARRYETWINSLSTPEAISRNLFVECPLPHPTLLIRRAVFREVGGYREVTWAEDYDLVLRLAAAGCGLANVPAVLHHWRESPRRLSRTDGRYDPAAFRACKAAYLPGLRLAGRPVIVWGSGPIGKQFARTLDRAGIEVVAFVDVDARKIGHHVGNIPIIAPRDVGTHRSRAYVVAAVGAVGARERILAALAKAGWRIPHDACAVA